MYCVYCHTNKSNQKKYIGITGTKPERRWANGEGYKRSRHFYFAIKTYGWESFAHEILFTGLTKERACQKEKELIRLYNTNDPQFGYNISTGGEGGAAGVHQTPEIIEKRRKAHIGRKVSEETRKRMSQAAKGRTFSKETLEKMRLAKAGKKWSEETRAKMKNRPPVIKTDEMKENARKAKADKMKPIYCAETNKIYKSIHEAAAELGLYPTNICAVCKGKYKHTKGFHFQYWN